MSGLFSVSFATETTTGVADSFTDVMGPDVEVVSVDEYDGAEPTVTGSTISWVPEEQAVEPAIISSGTFGGWYNGVAHMTCTVRLDPTRSNGIPTAAAIGDIFPTNDTASTVLSYHKESVSATPVISSGTVQPVSPEVRALLYDIELKKVDEQGNPLKGAVFTLYDENGESLGITATSKDDGTAKFHNLQYGTYKVKETQAPSGYTADTTEAGPYNLSWTSNSGSLTQDHASGHDADEADDVKNAILSGDMDEIVNKRAVTLVVHKTDNASPAQPLEGVYFELSGDTVYSDAACTTPAGALPTDEDGNVTFYGLKPGTYYLEETAALPGFEPLTEAVKVEVTVESNDLHIYFYEGDKRFEGVLDDSYTATFSLVNTPMPNLLVVKMDSTGKPLAGAEFTLSKSGATPQDETTAIDANVTQVGSYSCDTGLAVARFDSIASGEYTFEETRVPAGYQRGEGSYTVKAEGGKLYIKEGAGSYTECNIEVLDGKTYYYVGVENDGVPTLPVTGAEVPLLAGICGFVILVAGVSGLLTYDALSQGMPLFSKPHQRGRRARV